MNVRHDGGRNQTSGTFLGNEQHLVYEVQGHRLGKYGKHAAEVKVRLRMILKLQTDVNRG